MSGDDAELDAMRALKDALEPLDPEARERVITWVGGRLDIAVGSAGNTKGSDSPGGGGNGDDDEDGQNADDKQFEHFADLYAAAGPTTGAERALVAGYWQQKVLGESTFQSLALNRELKNLGHGLERISHDLDTSISEKPQLVLQLKKSGNTRQAKKTYKLTVEGIKRVEAMIAGGGS